MNLKVIPQELSKPPFEDGPVSHPEESDLMRHHKADHNHVEEDVLAHEIDLGPATDSILVLL